MQTLATLAAAVVLGGLSFQVMAQPRPLEAGQTHALLEPALATQSVEDIIEVIDVFWYGCPVCSEFAPMMTYWGGEVRGDLVMKRMPAVWNDIMALHARLYYTAVSLELGAPLHSAAFRHIHEEGKALNTVDDIREFFGAHGVTSEAFDQAWNAAEVLAAVDKAALDTKAAGIDRLPALLVNGRYRVVRSASVPTLPEMIIITNELIKTERDLRRPD
jgi:thiol:disulfide interchange protein DsbA